MDDLKDAFNEYFLDPIQNHYMDFEGRARRKQYWMFVAFNIAVSIVISIVIGMISDTLASGISGLYSLALLLPGLGLAVRRLHDTGRSGWFLLLVFIPLVNLILLYFMVIEGDAGPNEYGPDPKDPMADDLSNVLDTY